MMAHKTQTFQKHLGIHISCDQTVDDEMGYQYEYTDKFNKV